ncbi:MAG: TetR/AcrR family transcriptional regulator [Bacillota bacterium]
MPRPFSDAEREQINESLVEAARECWERYGIRRTSVDELVRRAGIPKGTFYLFYASKELLFMEVLERSHDRIKKRLLEVLTAERGSPRERFVSAVMKLYEEIRGNGWLVSLMGNSGEYRYLLRKLPAEKISRHIMGDDEDTAQFMQLFGLAGRISIAAVSAALRGIFFMLLHRQEVGEEQLDSAFHLLVEGLALRIFEGEEA